MINIQGKEGKRLLQQIEDMRHYLNIPYKKIYESYQEKREYVLLSYPCLKPEHINNVLFIENRALTLLKESLEDKMNKYINT